MNTNTNIEQQILRLRRQIAGQDSAITIEQSAIVKHQESIKASRERQDKGRFEVERLQQRLQRERDMERGRKWREENPAEHASLLTDIRQRNRDGAIEGWLDGWWDLDDEFNPIQLGQVFSLTDFKDVNNPLMAHVMAKAGIFPSVGQARKNGWDKPLVVGEWTVTKQKKKVIVKA